MPITFPRPRQSRYTLPVAGLKQLLERTPPGALSAPLASLAKCYEGVLDAHHRIATDATINAHAQLVRQAKSARSLLEPALGRLRQSRQVAQDAQADAQRRMTRLYDPVAAPTTTEAALVAGEIRFKLLGMPVVERLSRLRTAVEQGDTLMLRAVAVAPAFTLDLPDAVHDDIKNRLVSLDDDARQARDVVEAISAQLEAAQQIEDQIGNRRPI